MKLQLQPSESVVTSTIDDDHFKRNLTFTHLIPTNFDDIHEQVETKML